MDEVNGNQSFIHNPLSSFLNLFLIFTYHAGYHTLTVPQLSSDHPDASISTAITGPGPKPPYTILECSALRPSAALKLKFRLKAQASAVDNGGRL